MSDEFIKLDDLINKGKLELRIKKSLNKKDVFGIWFFWYCKTKPSVLNLFGNAFYVYFILTTDWFWLPLAVFIGFKFGWIYGLLTWVVHYIIQRIVFSGIGQGFMLYDAQHNENLFDDLWQNQSIGILSVKKRDSVMHEDGVPVIIIDPHNQDWRKEIKTGKFD
jgi:hypothetical protein